jgi:hypothetical protein
MSDRDGIYRVDRMRIWNATTEFIARAEMRAPAGKIFVVHIIAVEAHPMPTATRPRKKRDADAPTK